MSEKVSCKILHDEVLLLKEKEQEQGHDSYETAFSAAGRKAHFMPVLTFNNVNTDELMEVLMRPGDFSCLVFTSQRAVDVVKQCLTDELIDGWRNKSIYAVGKVTGEAVRRLGFEVRGYEAGKADGLLNIILGDNPDKNKPILFPCGNLRRETLPRGLREAGYQVHDLVVYETGRNPTVDEKFHDLLNKGIPEFVCFFSPSEVIYTKDLFLATGETDQFKFISMGPSTSRALTDNGMTVSAEASEPTVKGVVEAVIRARNDS